MTATAQSALGVWTLQVQESCITAEAQIFISACVTAFKQQGKERDCKRVTHRQTSPLNHTNPKIDNQQLGRTWSQRWGAAGGAALSRALEARGSIQEAYCPSWGFLAAKSSRSCALPAVAGTLDTTHSAEHMSCSHGIHDSRCTAGSFCCKSGRR